jgi:predicted CoA-binding protein
MGHLPAMSRETYSDELLRELLAGAKVIAVVGASPKPERDSHQIMAMLQRHGYRTIPVNPQAAGGTILGERVYASLAEVPEPIDIVDVFRNSEAAGAILMEAAELGLKTIWLQLGVRNDDAAAAARAKGATVIQDRCIKVEYWRLIGG